METKTFFALLFTMLLIGTMGSMMTGATIAAFPDIDFAPQAINTSAQYACVEQWRFLAPPVTVCSWTGGVAQSDIIGQALLFIGNAIDTIFQMVAFVVSATAYFTGITMVFGTGALVFPAPLNIIASAGILFGWILLVLEFATRIKSMIPFAG